jgi:hypothetical protein
MSRNIIFVPMYYRHKLLDLVFGVIWARDKLFKAYKKANNDISFVSGEYLMNIHHMQYVKWCKVSRNLDGDNTQLV